MHDIPRGQSHRVPLQRPAPPRPGSSLHGNVLACSRPSVVQGSLLPCGRIRAFPGWTGGSLSALSAHLSTGTLACLVWCEELVQMFISPPYSPSGSGPGWGWRPCSALTDVLSVLSCPAGSQPQCGPSLCGVTALAGFQTPGVCAQRGPFLPRSWTFFQVPYLFSGEFCTQASFGEDCGSLLAGALGRWRTQSACTVLSSGGSCSSVLHPL